MQFKFSKPISDSTFDAGDFLFSSDNFSTSDAGTTFSTSRSDGVVDTDANDEYVSISFNPAKVQGTGAIKFKYLANNSGAKSVKDLSNNSLADVSTATDTIDSAQPVIIASKTVSTNYIQVTFSEKVALADGKIPTDANAAFSASGITISGVYKGTSGNVSVDTTTSAKTLYIKTLNNMADNFTANDFAIAADIFDDKASAGGNNNLPQTGLTIADGFVKYAVNPVATASTSIDTVTFAFDEYPGDSAEGITAYYIGFARDKETFNDWIQDFNSAAGDTEDEKLANLVSVGRLEKIVATTGTDGTPTPIGPNLTKTIAGASLTGDTPYEEFVITYDSVGNGIVMFGSGVNKLLNN